MLDYSTQWLVLNPPAHGACGIPVKPGGNALLTENVLAVKHGGFLVRILQLVIFLQPILADY